MAEVIVLIGAAGRIARQIRPYLSRQCSTLRIVDQAPLTCEHENEEVFQVDLTDAPGLQAAVRGAQAIVHFAGYPREADWATLLAANVLGVTNLWEAARLEGVGRVLYASSNHAVGMYPREVQISERALPFPDSRYGVTKVFMEAVAVLYAAKHGVRGFGMRIGHCSAQPGDARMLSHWLHPDDLCDLLRVGLTADYQNEIVFGVSNNSRSWWNNARAEVLGYRPKHSADGFADQFRHAFSADPVAERLQGGAFAAAELGVQPDQVISFPIGASA